MTAEGAMGIATPSAVCSRGALRGIVKFVLRRKPWAIRQDTPKAVTTLYFGFQVAPVSVRLHAEERTSGAMECQSAIVTKRSSTVTEKS